MIKSGVPVPLVIPARVKRLYVLPQSNNPAIVWATYNGTGINMQRSWRSLSTSGALSRGLNIGNANELVDWFFFHLPTNNSLTNGNMTIDVIGNQNSEKILINILSDYHSSFRII